MPALHTCKCSHCGTTGSILPGWFCNSCSSFNGEAKEKRTECRSCGNKRLTGHAWRVAKIEFLNAKRDAQIRELRAKGLKYFEIANIVGCSRSTAHTVCTKTLGELSSSKSKMKDA